jgi:hypothetical protein
MSLVSHSSSGEQFRQVSSYGDDRCRLDDYRLLPDHVIGEYIPQGSLALERSHDGEAPGRRLQGEEAI